MTTFGDQRFKKSNKGRRNTTAGMGNLFKTAIGSAFANFLTESLD